MPTLNVNIDENMKCNRCGKGGVASSEGKTRGLCLSCINKELAADAKERITNQILQEISGDLEKLLLEKQQQINFAFKRVADGFKISIGVTLDNTIPPTATYSVSFPLEPSPDPPEKEKVTLTKQIGQTELGL